MRRIAAYIHERGDVDITRWLEWFLGCLGRAIDGAEQTLSAVLSKARMWQRTIHAEHL